MSLPKPLSERSPQGARAPLSVGMVGFRRCLGCGGELAPPRKGACCSGRCRAALSRQRKAQAERERIEEVRGLLEAALRKLEPDG